LSAAILSAIETLGGSLVADPETDSAGGEESVAIGGATSSAPFVLLKAMRSERLDRLTGGSGVLICALFAFSSSSFCFIIAMRSFTDIGADIVGNTKMQSVCARVVVIRSAGGQSATTCGSFSIKKIRRFKANFVIFGHVSQ